MLKQLSSKKNIKSIVIIYHLVFTIISWLYLVSVLKMTDPDRFYKLASASNNWFDLFGTGSKFITFLIYPLVTLNIPPIVISVVFSLIGLKGFLLFVDMLFNDSKEDDNSNAYLYLIFLLLPTLHFWTSFISKDALLFYLMTFILHHLYSTKKKLFQIVIVLFFVLMIRPYVFFILVIAFAIHYVFNNSFNLKKGIVIVGGLLLLLITTFPILQSFLKLETLSILNFNKAFHQVVLYAQQNGKSSIDLANSNYFDRFILVLFRPFVFESITYKQLIVSIENILTWGIIVKLLVVNRILFFNRNMLFPLLVAVFLILFYSIYMYNMGLASRMRVMFVPYLFFVLFCNLHNKNIPVIHKH